MVWKRGLSFVSWENYVQVVIHFSRIHFSKKNYFPANKRGLILGRRAKRYPLKNFKQLAHNSDFYDYLEMFDDVTTRMALMKNTHLKFFLGRLDPNLEYGIRKTCWIQGNKKIKFMS
jgi:hypothetical protein